jgi:hypothetical protein
MISEVNNVIVVFDVFIFLIYLFFLLSIINDKFHKARVAKNHNSKLMKNVTKWMEYTLINAFDYGKLKNYLISLRLALFK